ncbi:hypothetical protein JM654_02230 [Microbacterium oxydans]|nr:hypothetical protein [Microbacterium oxydans]
MRGAGVAGEDGTGNAGRHRRQGDDRRAGALERGEVPRGARDAEDEWKQHEGQTLGDVLRLGCDDHAPRALVQVQFEALVIASAEVAARVRAQVLDGPLAL